VAGALGGDGIDGVRCVGSGHSAPSTANAPPRRLRPPRGSANPAMGRSRIGLSAGERTTRIRRLDDVMGDRGGFSDSPGACVAERAVGTRTMAALKDRFRNRFNGAAIRGDLNLPETRGLNRRGGSGQVIGSGAAGLGAGGLARWPGRDGLRWRTVGTVSADTIGFGTGRPSPGRRPRSRAPRANVGARSGPASSSRVSAFGVVGRQRRSPDGG